jgi:hypothetical protein
MLRKGEIMKSFILIILWTAAFVCSGCASVVSQRPPREPSLIIEALVYDYYHEEDQLPESMDVLTQWVTETRFRLGQPIQIVTSQEELRATSQPDGVYVYRLYDRMGDPFRYERLDEHNYVLRSVLGDVVFYGDGRVSLRLQRGPWDDQGSSTSSFTQPRGGTSGQPVED